MSAQAIFRTVAREWWARYMLRGAAHYAEESWRRLEREALPVLGELELGHIGAPLILGVLRRVEARGSIEAAHKLKSHISQIMRYGIGLGLIYNNPARDLSYALTPKKSVPRAAIIDPRQAGRLALTIERYKPGIMRCALQLAALLFVRPGELRRAEWSEIEFEAAEWRIPALKMKMRRPHIVPLARQSLGALRELRVLGGQGRWLFPSRRDPARPMGGKAINQALRRAGCGPELMTAHGFRAMAATLLSERGWAGAVIERQLAHKDRNAARAAYQRSRLLAERRKMMQDWADYLDILREQALVVV